MNLITDVRVRMSRMDKVKRVEYFKMLNKVAWKYFSKHKLDPEKIWFDIDRDEIIKTLETDKKYDAYVISKRGRIKIRRNKPILKILALRFRYYKKYMVIAEVVTEAEKEEAEELGEIIGELNV